MMKIVLSAMAILFTASTFASANVVVKDALVFGDGTKQTTATVQWPVGLQGATGDPGPVGPAGPQGTKGDTGAAAPPLTLASICAAMTAGGISLCPPVTLTDPTTGMVFHKVTGGTFTMGDTFGDSGVGSNELPLHQVTVSDFYIGKYEVTQAEWQTVMTGNSSAISPTPSYFTACGVNCPVEQVSWNDIQIFISRLKAQSGKNYRLPTEAEWEYAARSGGQSQNYSGVSDVNVVAWYSSNSSSTTHVVGTKQANGLGLYDMSGNVWEWVNDWNGSYGSTAQTNPKGPISGSGRVDRGGCWANDAYNVRASIRGSISPDIRFNTLGFRLVAPVQ